jgi:hypothetical protein
MKISILLVCLFLTQHCYGQPQITTNTTEKDAVVFQIKEKLNLNRHVEKQIQALISLAKYQVLR